MSIDSSLKSQSSLARHRNVLTRSERMEILLEAEWDKTKGALGLPKISHRKAKAGKKKDDEEKAEEGAETEGEETAAETKE